MTAVLQEAFAEYAKHKTETHNMRMEAMENLNKQVYRRKGPESLPSMKKTAGSSDLSLAKKVFGDPAFGSFAKDAYDSSEGYAIRVNPLTGEKEMFIAGTRNPAQWGLNVYDGAAQLLDSATTEVGNLLINDFAHGIAEEVVGIPSGLLPDISFSNPHLFEKVDVFRKSKTKYLQEIAQKNGIDVIYGHSRGGALVADMDVPGATKVGLDSAMIITHNTGMVNYNEWGTGSFGQAFDGLLGLTGEANVPLDMSKYSPHYVYSKEKPWYL